MQFGPFRVLTTSNSLPRIGQIRTTISRIAFSLIALFALASIPAQAQTYTDQTLYSFNTNQATNDGYQSYSTLLVINGTLYGTTEMGGKYGKGTVFAVNPTTHAETIIHTFNGGDGAQPQAGLINVNGTLYGVTYQGGSAYAGTLFSLNPDGTAFQVLYNFSSSATDGGYPEATLLNVNGTLYGTTFNGGSDSEGVLFSYNTATRVESTVHQFTGTTGDGYGPFDSLINVNGVLYGTTVYGGWYNKGTIFSINADGTGYQIVSHFTGAGGDGCYPIGGLAALNGLLYGTTQSGGSKSSGTLFAFDPSSHQETPLYSFTGGSDGGYPEASLLNVNGTLYGTAFGGGLSQNGTVFSYNPATKVESTVHQFLGYPNDGGAPRATLVNEGSTLYGTTTTGGSTTTGSGGLIFALTSTATTGTAPIAANDSYFVKYHTALTITAPGVLANDKTGGSTPLTASLLTTTTHGTLTLNSDGSFTYMPGAGFTGHDTFTYKAVNAVGSSNTATVTFSVIATPPVAHSDSATVQHNLPFVCPSPGILRNDDNSSSPYAMTAALVSGPAHGILLLNSDGSFVYTPNLGYSGSDSFTYQAVSAVGKSNIVPCTLTVK